MSKSKPITETKKRFTVRELNKIHIDAINECVDLQDGKERKALERLASAASWLARVRK